MSGRCFVPVGKVRDYLLNPDHDAGGPKCAFFTAHGFERSKHHLLAEAFVEHFEANAVFASIESPYGLKLLIQAPLKTLDGRTPVVRSVWIASPPDLIPSLVTAFPR